MSIKMEDPVEATKDENLKVSFQSKELEALLDVIDQLRAQGISRFIDLPQMIVCGDQSSGKSSVLEAVSGIRFPTKDNLCTRFPTELILRRSPEHQTSISIVPDASRDDQEQAQLEAFDAGPDGLANFGDTVDAAAKAMGLDKNSKSFSNDVLRVELTGPKLPHLTLVDLPGLFHAGSKSQSTSDADAVKALVTKYMEKSRSIILAVVSAKNDYANQIVTEYARDVDEDGERTLGVITKPDTLHPGSESEKQFFELAQNKDVVLRLGWHVLKNRDFDTKDCSAEERDQLEADFFSKGIWTSLRPTQMGIATLKPRLSRVLRDQILSELPNLIADVKSGISECEGRLERLGGPRSTKLQQRTHLHLISQNFSKLVRYGVSGNYQEPYFRNSPKVKGYIKRIRAIVFNKLDDFKSEMNGCGHTYHVIDEQLVEESVGTPVPESVEETYEEPGGQTGEDIGSCVPITRTNRLRQIEGMIRQNRGLELPGFTKPEIVTMLFRQQCQPWSAIVFRCLQDVFESVSMALYHALEETADTNTCDGILGSVVNPALDIIRKDLEHRTAVNLKQHIDGQPMTFNQYFTDNVQKLRQDHQIKYLETRLLTYFNCVGQNPKTEISTQFRISDLAKALAKNIEEDGMTFTCSEALFYMEAYYQVALEFFIDDFTVHTIEQGLLEKLEGIFDPSTIFGLDDETIADIAGETEESQIERQSSSTKLASLRKALEALHRLDRGRPKGSTA